MAKILLVEDDPEHAELIRDWLKKDVHFVDVVDNGADALHLLGLYKFDLLILDWNIPEMSGVDLCKEFRERGGTTPILMLTGKAAIEDKEQGFDSGADDYLTKPVNLRELSARTRSLMRRGNTVVNSSKLVVGDITMDTQSRLVTRNGQSIDLLPREFALLELFCKNPTRVFSVDELISSVWSYDQSVSDHAVRVCISRLRTKLDVEGRESVLESVYSVGYRIRQK